jgi:thioredoxin 1
MSQVGRIAVVILLAVGIAAVIMIKRGAAPASPDVPLQAASITPDVVAGPSLPRILDLGATQCIPCKMMAPILEELKKEYAGKMQVDFIDVWKDETAGDKYAIKGIPTQIFFDASGKELYRHEGFMPKEDILAKCKELGFDLK